MKVMRSVLNFGTQLATTRRWVSLSAAVPGKREAVCPSGPMPRKIRSKRGNWPGDRWKKSLSVCSYCRAAAAASFSSPRMRKIFSGAHRDLGEQGFVGHPVVALGMVGRNVALVAPEKIDLVPRDAGLGGQQGVQGFRRRTTGESDGESAVGPHRFGRLERRTWQPQPRIIPLQFSECEFQVESAC